MRKSSRQQNGAESDENQSSNPQSPSQSAKPGSDTIVLHISLKIFCRTDILENMVKSFHCMGVKLCGLTMIDVCEHLNSCISNYTQ